MWENLELIHFKHSQSSQPQQTQECWSRLSSGFPDYFLWQTCLRNVLVSDSCITPPFQGIRKKTLGSLGEYYTGYSAYRFLLEIVLGLHSDILGETEVFHQFRRHFQYPEKKSLGCEVLYPYIKKLYNDITVDTRKIRTNYLRGLGELSYGGAARYCLKEASDIVILGNGQLAKTIVPWLLKDRHRLRVIGRSLETLAKLKSEFSPIETSLYSGLRPHFFDKNTALVIAAPISETQLEDLTRRLSILNIQILDFRPESSTILSESPRYYPLRKITAQIQASQKKREQLLHDIEPELEQIIQRRCEMPLQSNLSWEDATVEGAFVA